MQYYKKLSINLYVYFLELYNDLCRLKMKINHTDLLSWSEKTCRSLKNKVENLISKNNLPAVTD